MNFLFGTLPDVAQRYPLLAGLMEGYFHQDFDLNGNTVAEVMNKWKDDSTAADAEALRLEVAAFEAASPGEVGHHGLATWARR